MKLRVFEDPDESQNEYGNKSINDSDTYTLVKHYGKLFKKQSIFVKETNEEVLGRNNFPSSLIKDPKSSHLKYYVKRIMRI
jgi:hypothetical protein